MTTCARARLLLFGASGAIGGALTDWFLARGWQIDAITRSLDGHDTLGNDALRWHEWNPESTDVRTWLLGSYDAVIWAQGHNFNDSIQTFDTEQHVEMYGANVVYILQSLRLLLQHEALKRPCRLCILSSIWQEIARQNKLSYTVCKAALKGAVQSLAIDLGGQGHLVNAILPGALDTPMTRANLSQNQLAALQAQTPLHRLSTLGDVCSLAGFLCSPENTGITGQFIAADGGFSHARIL